VVVAGGDPQPARDERRRLHLDRFDEIKPPDRSVQTAPRARPVRPDVGIASDALVPGSHLAARVAVISDVHANWHALQAVLAAIDREQTDELWCLGDLVGYGPRPNPCCTVVRERAALSLAGNHDLGVLGQLDLEEFAPDAVASARWTRGVLEPEARSFLESLSPSARRDGVELFHASPRDPVWDYILSAEAAEAAFELTEEPLVLVGHSHVPLALAAADGALAGGLAPEGTEAELRAGPRLVLNPGSVGQPRDGDPRAAWLLLDFQAGIASFRRVAYPVERTQEEIRERGLPDALAERLARGI
jgi:diadenosine tetraphosphatase ApaH/serine/threonine PP2A family protein phosphatase